MVQNVAEKKYLFAEKKEQIRRANDFLVKGTVVFYLCVLALVWIATLRKIRTPGYATMITLVVLLITAAMIAVNRLRPYNNSNKYVALAGMFVIGFLMGYAFHNYYVRFMAVVPFVGCVLFFDDKFACISGAMVSFENILVTVVKNYVMHMYVGEDVMD